MATPTLSYFVCLLNDTTELLIPLHDANRDEMLTCLQQSRLVSALHGSLRDYTLRSKLIHGYLRDLDHPSMALINQAVHHQVQSVEGSTQPLRAIECQLCLDCTDGFHQFAFLTPEGYTQAEVVSNLGNALQQGSVKLVVRDIAGAPYAAALDDAHHSILNQHVLLLKSFNHLKVSNTTILEGLQFEELFDTKSQTYQALGGQDWVMTVNTEALSNPKVYEGRIVLLQVQGKYYFRPEIERDGGVIYTQSVLADDLVVCSFLL